MRIIWDERKRLANLDKHGMDFASLTLEFFRYAIFVPAKRGRTIAIGMLDSATTVIFVEMGTEALSVISMRSASSRERKLL